MHRLGLGWVALALVSAGCGGAPGDFDEVSAVEGADDAEASIDTVEQEIWLGTPAAGNLATVELWRSGKNYPNCSAFFVNRYYLVTASHCTSRYYSAEWFQVRIKTGYNTFTNLKDRNRSDNWVRLTVYQHPNYGTDRGSDLALLYIEPQNQASIPANQQMMRVSTATPPVGEQLGIWGWGIRSAGSTPPRDLLTPSTSQQITVSGTSSRMFWAHVNNSARTCQGDSGGPATRYQSNVHVAVGSHIGPTYVAGDQPWACAESGVRMDWAKLGDKSGWIENTLKLKLGSSFACSRFGSGSTAYMRCF